MTDRPIIFSAPMIRVLLDGRKTQTRRVLKPQPGENATHFRSGRGKHIWDWPGLGVGSDDGLELPKVPYAPGDRLWVRETCATWEGGHRDVVYRANVSDKDWSDLSHDARSLAPWKIRSSIHMPRWASRLSLTLTDVRVQRLQEISEADVTAEGITRGFSGGPHGEEGLYEDFADLWNSIHGPDAWGANPWVVCFSFDVHRCNIDQMGEDQ